MDTGKLKESKEISEKDKLFRIHRRFFQKIPFIVPK